MSKFTVQEERNILEVFVPYLINNDSSGMSAEEVELCNAWTQKHGLYAIYDCSEHTNFCRCHITREHGTCIEVKVLVPMDKEGESIL